MKVLLLGLGFYLIGASSQDGTDQITGDWRTIYMAADNVEKIDENGDQRLYFRHFQCSFGCNLITITFFHKVNGECKKHTAVALKTLNDVYEVNFKGLNFLNVEYFATNATAFHNTNVVPFGKITSMTVLIAKQNSVSEEERQKFEDLTVKYNIPKENIRNLIETDDCPDA